ncbi:MAG: AsmA-like C-terminal region-containing protein, partial [Rhodospirillaceae bacterium]
IYVGKARSQGIVVTGGRIVLSGLNQVDQFADIDLNLKGSIADKLAYIDRKPLQFASALSIDPRQAGGTAATRLRLFFILEKTLSLEQVQVWARSRLDDVSMANVFLGRAINKGTLDLRVDKRGMTVNGSAQFDSIPATFAWRENFDETPEFRSRYTVTARLDDIDHIRDLGLDMAPFTGDFIRGAVTANVAFTVLDDVDRHLEVDADITAADLKAPAFGWAKPAGTEGRARVVLNLARDLVIGIPEFSVEAADLTVKGAAKYALDGTGLERIDFQRVAYGRTDVSGSLIPRADGTWDAGFRGESFDLSPMWRDLVSREAGRADSGQRMLDRLTLAVELKKVWLDEKMALSDVSGTFARADDMWRTVLLNSRVDADTRFDLTIQPGADGNRRLIMRSGDAGRVLSFLDLYPNMIGGMLTVTGTYDDAAPGQPLKGLISVTDYRVVNAPVLTRLLSIMALTGILEALQGEGLAFTDLSIPFELNEGTFTLKDARASGTSLGFTASGKVFRHADIVNLQGTVIPAYALNSAFGRIPLLGDLFTGGEKGGGVFAATYTMTGPMEEPVVSVNPLSALAPGFLRNVFGIIGKAGKEPSLLNGEEPPASRFQ